MRHPVGVLIFVGAVVLLTGIGIAVCEALDARDATPPRVLAQPPVIVECLDPTLELFAPLWRAEIGRRFDNAVVILVHGGDFVAGEWIVAAGFGGHVTPVKEIVQRFQKLHPGRTVCLISCNPGGVKLGIPGVYYGKSNIWCVPDRALGSGDTFTESRTFSDGDAGMIPQIVVQVTVEKPKTRWQLQPDFLGNAYELITD
jgi:hypothetical protein